MCKTVDYSGLVTNGKNSELPLEVKELTQC